MAGALGAQQPADPARPPAAQPEDLASLSGKVLRLGQDQPLTKVKLTLVNLLGGTNYNAETDAAGAFQMEKIEPGSYWLIADKAGFVRQEYGARRPGEFGTGTVLTLRDGVKPSPLVIKMAAHGVVGGKVTDKDGDPIAHAVVQLMRYRYFRGRRMLVPLTTSWGAMTNELGEYRIGGIPPGEYYISAVLRQFTPPASSAANGPQRAFVPAFYPSAPRPQEAQAVSVTAGVELNGFDIQLPQARTVRVKGQVMNVPEGQGIMAVLSVAGEPAIGLFSSQYMQVQSSGAFEFAGVTPGEYVLYVQSTTDGQPRSVRIPVQVANTDVEEVSLVVSGSASVTGTLAIETDQQSDSSPDAAKKIPKGVRVQLSSVENLFVPEASTTVAEDGTFNFPSLGLARYEVRVTGLPHNSWVKKIQAGDQELPARVLDLSSGASAGPLSVQVKLTAGAVTGKALNNSGNSVSDAT